MPLHIKTLFRAGVVRANKVIWRWDFSKSLMFSYIIAYLRLHVCLYIVKNIFSFRVGGGILESVMSINSLEILSMWDKTLKNTIF